MRRTTISLLAFGWLIALPGCCCFDKCRLFHRPDNSRLDAPAPTHGPDPLLIPPPPGGLPTPPPPSLDAPRGGDLPPPVMPETRNYQPAPVEKKNGKELVLPDPLPNESSKGRGYLESPAEVRASDSTTAKSLPKATPEKMGVPGFALVRDGIATGRKPSIEGFDNLKNSSYKTVVYLHAPDADVSAAKTIAEKRGLSFVAIPVSADNAKTSYGKFVEIAGNSAAKPMYVFDDDGVRTGCFWYAYFRNVDGLGDDAALIRAAPLGLRDARGDEKTKLWDAVQDFLAKK